jgi:hypothetical protein
MVLSTTTIFGLLLTALVSTTTPVIKLESVEPAKAEANPEKQLIVRTIRDLFGSEAPTMIAVAECESSLSHTKDNEVLRGVVDNRDSGVFQVNKGYHEERAKKLGLDIDKLEHNIVYAKILYDQEGLRPWKASYECLREKGIKI